VRNGVVGGCIGGLLGGLFFEYMRIFKPGGLYTRLVGLVLLGFFIGLFYGFIENRLTRASLVLLNGRFRGREFPLTQRFTRIGGSPKTEVGLPGYKNVADVHVEVTREKGEYVLTDAGSKTGAFVNEEKTEKTVLREGDVIRVGDAQFQFRKK
jgi:pSer/pThr/pTyr-binding forkhead associated (FHA) protein